MNTLDLKIEELARNRLRMTRMLAHYDAKISMLKDRAAEQNAKASARIGRNIEELDKALETLRSVKNQAS